MSDEELQAVDDRLAHNLPCVCGAEWTAVPDMRGWYELTHAAGCQFLAALDALGRES